MSKNDSSRGRISPLSVVGWAAMLALTATLAPGAQSKPRPRSRAAARLTRRATRQRAALTAPASVTRMLREKAAATPAGTPSGRSRGWSSITEEGFEGTFPPTDWVAEDGDTSAPEAYWGKDDWQKHSGGYSAYCVRGGAQGVDPATDDYPNNASSWLVYGPFSLADASQATLEFYAWTDTEQNYDYFWWMASNNGVDFGGFQDSGNSGGWAVGDLDLSDVGPSHDNMCGEAEVWIAFIFQSDSSNTAKGVFVDDVVLQQYTPDVSQAAPISPINHTTLTTSYPPFEWTPATGATAYEIIVDDSDTFTEPFVFSDSNVTGTTVTPSSPIADGTYYWKVRGKDAGGPGSWTDVWDFTIDTTSPPEWTFMVYLDADNSLEDYGLDDFYEMVSGAGNSNVNICLLFDRAAGYVTTYDNWTTTRRYKLTSSSTAYDSSPDYVDLGELNMGHPQTIVDFVTWAQTNYPAQHYALVYWDHGSGWQPRALGLWPTKAICSDDQSGDFLSLNELYDAMGAFPEKIDVVGMDACLMGQTEVAFQIKDRCDYFVASEDNEPGPGWAYDLILPAAHLPAGTTPAQLAQKIVQAYQSYYDVYDQNTTQSAWASAGLTTCANKISALASQLIAGLPTYQTEIGSAYTAAQHFESAVYGKDSYLELYGFCDYLTQYINDSGGKGPNGRIARGIKSAAQDLMDFLTSPGFQTAEWHDAGGYPAGAPLEGLTIYFPDSSSETYYGNYNGTILRFVDDPAQLWDDFLKAYLEGVSPPAPPENLLAQDHPGDSGGALDVTWDRSPDDGIGDDDVTEYRIFRDHALIDTVAATNSASYAYADDGLTNGTSYCYIVRAYDGTMESPDSNDACAIPLDNSNVVVAVDLDPGAPGVQDTRTVPTGATFDVAIWALGVQDLASYNVVVQWDSSHLTVNDATQGPFLQSAGGGSIFLDDLHGDWLEASEAVTSPTEDNSPDGDGVLFTISFTAADIGAAPVEFSTSLGSGTRFGDPNSQYVVPTLQAATLTVGIPGDMDGDGDVDVADLSQFRVHWGGLDSGATKGRATCGTYDAACDLSQDGEINRDDFWAMWYDNGPNHTEWVPGDVTGAAASAGCPEGYPDAGPDDYLDFWDLVAFASHWHTESGDGNWDECFDFATSSGLTPPGGPKPVPADGVVNFYDLVAFAGAWHTGDGPAPPAAGSKMAPAEKRPVFSLQVQPEGTLLPGDEVEVTVAARDVVDLRAYDFQLSYDPEVCDLVACASEDGSFLESAGGEGLFMRDVRLPGRVWLTGALAEGDATSAPDGSGVLARVRLRVRRSARASVVALTSGLILSADGEATGASPQQLSLEASAFGQGDWRCPVTAQCGGQADRDNYLGVIADPQLRRAAASSDKVEDGLCLSFVTDEGPSSRQYLAPSAGTLVYRFIVENAPPDADVTVSLPDLSALPRRASARLVDEAAGRAVSVRTQSVYTYHTANGPSRAFRVEVEPEAAGQLLVTGLAAVPTRGRAVSIDFSLSRAAAADMGIYNLAGRHVRRLVEGDFLAAGRQSIVWDGRSDAGTIVPAGTYIIRVGARASDGAKAQAITALSLAR